MIDKRAKGYIDAEVQQAELAVLSQKDNWGFARVAGPRVCVLEIGKAKNPQTELGREAYKGRVTAFELDYNIYGERLRWSSFCAKPLTSPRGGIQNPMLSWIWLEA